MWVIIGTSQNAFRACLTKRGDGSFPFASVME
jgi:hypothetical protein